MANIGGKVIFFFGTYSFRRFSMIANIFFKVHIWSFYQEAWASPVAQLVKNLPAVWETWVQSLGWEDPLEKGKVTTLQYSGLENSRDYTVHGVTKTQTRLRDSLHFTSLHWSSQIALVVKNLPANAGDRRLRFNPWVRKIPWRREWQFTPVFLPGESYGQSSLVGYSP